MEAGVCMTAVTRLPDWEGRLERFFEACESRRFRYGTFDCCLFGADAIREETGQDPMANLRIYRGMEEARRLLKSLGGLERAIADSAATFGLKEIPVLMARRGDLVLLGGRTAAAGILGLDGRMARFPDRQGLRLVPVELCRRAWRVG